MSDKLTRYQKLILNAFLKNKDLNSLFNNGEFGALEDVILPEFWYELVEIFLKANILLPETVLKHYNEIKNLGIDLYKIPFKDHIYKDSYGYLFGYNSSENYTDIPQLCATIKFLRLLGEGKLDNNQQLDLSQVEENLLNVDGFEIRFSILFKKIESFHGRLHLSHLENYPSLYLEFISNATGEILYQQVFGSLKDKEDIYVFNENLSMYEIDVKKLIIKINNIIENLNKM